jgi:hypothetical protein
MVDMIDQDYLITCSVDKVGQKINLCYFSNFQRTAHCQESPNRQKFAQSGRPVYACTDTAETEDKKSQVCT